MEEDKNNLTVSAGAVKAKSKLELDLILTTKVMFSSHHKKNKIINLLGWS